VVQRAGEPQLAGRRLILGRREGSVRRRFAAALAALTAAFALCSAAAAQNRFPGKEWDHVAPAQAGWSEAGLTEARGWSQNINSTAVMVIHHGTVVAEWGDTAKRTELASVRKSFLSALMGIAVAEHKVSLDSTLAQLGIDDNPPSLTEVEKQATVRMLLQARSGIYHPALYETRGMAAQRPLRGSHPPGTFWYYNNWDFNALGTIYEHATGTGIYDALDRQIARPIGMQDYRPQDGTYFTGPDSIHRAYPIRMSARDLARFALLFLRNGAWAGRQVVPADWVHESTRPYSTSAEMGTGYGYLWWTALPAPAQGMLPEGTFFAHGAGGQVAFVVPSCDLVLVSRVDRDLKLPTPTRTDQMKLLNLALNAGGLYKGQ
jgi:CubicO group peptidase (beta-lactamase class C family)